MNEEFDHHGAAFALGHRAMYREARSTQPILRTCKHGSFAVLTRYAECRAVLRDDATFLSGRFPDGTRLGGGVAIPPNAMRIGMIEMDGAPAKALRALLQPWFSIQAVEAAAERIGQIVDWTIDRVIDRGKCDVVSDLARPVPTLLILDILGLPFDRAERYGEILHEAVAKATGSADGMRWLTADLSALVAQGDFAEGGLIDAMVRERLDGEPLGEALVVELTMMLLFGGSDTTIATIGHALRHFTLFPEDRAALIADPALVPRAIEEILRLYSPSTGSARTVAADTEIGGEPFRQGERILCALNSANRDERQFDHPEIYDVRRPRRPHLAFGWGAHACLGQNLARADMRIMLEQILLRMADFAVDLEATRPYDSIPLVDGYHTMPLRFTPASRRAPPAQWPSLTAPRLRPSGT